MRRWRDDMKRSGGVAGRPMAHLAITDLEVTVTSSGADKDELILVLAELGYRKSRRAMQLRDLVKRMLDERERLSARSIGPLFD